MVVSAETVFGSGKMLPKKDEMAKTNI